MGERGHAKLSVLQSGRSVPHSMEEGGKGLKKALILYKRPCLKCFHESLEEFLMTTCFE